MAVDLNISLYKKNTIQSTEHNESREIRLQSMYVFQCTCMGLHSKPHNHFLTALFLKVIIFAAGEGQPQSHWISLTGYYLDTVLVAIGCKILLYFMDAGRTSSREMVNIWIIFLLKVECWLNCVLEHMRATVRHEMTEAVMAYEEKAREQWLFDYPAQVAPHFFCFCWSAGCGYDGDHTGSTMRKFWFPHPEQLPPLLHLVSLPVNNQQLSFSAIWGYYFFTGSDCV